MSDLIVDESEYMGKPVIVIKNGDNDRFPLSFGLAKAKKVVGAIDKIKEFVKKHDKPAE